MPQDRFNLTGRAALLAAIAAACPVIGYSAPAAQVDFAVGNVTAVGSNGQSRALGKGAQIEQGDTVNTNGGRAQLRFTDGAYVSLQPESQFRIDQYRFEGKTDGNEKGLFSLLKGGLRTITGLVGRRNKANYQISTSVATIGIRGTEYTIQYGKSITGTVGEGEIEVCNGAGCLSVTNGESYYVQTQEIKPVLTNKRADLPPPEPTSPPTNFTQGDNVDPGGNPLPGFVFAGIQKLDYVSASLCDGFCLRAGSNAQVVFDAAGHVIDFLGMPGTATTYGNDAIMAWGTVINSSNSLIEHFVTGLPTTSPDLAQLGGTTASYVLIGSTPITDFSGTKLGSLDTSSLTVNFGTGAIGVALGFTTKITPSDLAVLQGTATYSASIGAPGQQTSNFSAIAGSCTIASAACSTGFFGGNNAMKGSFFGPTAMRAGLIYGLSVTSASSFVELIGAAAYAKKTP